MSGVLRQRRSRGLVIAVLRLLFSVNYILRFIGQKRYQVKYLNLPSRSLSRFA